jgi:restriction system protein
MIRSMGGYYADKFAKGFVAIGWERIGDLAKATDTDAIRNKFQAAYPQYKKGAVAGAVATLRKFRHEIEVGDWVITYDPSKREYLIGKVASDYFFDPKQISEEFPHVRKVTWEHRISRDALSPLPRIRLEAR